jgi:hypothetical protein
VTTQNAYATLTEYLRWITARGGSASVDVVDDYSIEAILKGSSRYIDRQSGRSFMPYVETRYFDTPTSESSDTRLLKMDADLLEVFSITNGDGTTVASTEYILLDAGQLRNNTPYWYIRLKNTSTILWTLDTAGGYHGSIAVSGLWGYRDRYATNAWTTGSTLAEALDTSETGFDVTSGTLFVKGQMIRVDNELSYLDSVTNNTLTGTRAANGSTAAAHDNGDTVSIWQVQEDIKETCLQIAQNVYSMRSGQSAAGRITVSAAGIVIRPEEVPAMAQAVITSYRRRT